MTKYSGNGEFDRILVRPRNIILQVLGANISFERVGRSTMAIILFVYLLVSKPELIRADILITLILMIIGTFI